MTFTLRSLLIAVAAVACLCGAFAIAKDPELPLPPAPKYAPKPPVVYERCWYGCTMEIGRGIVICETKRDGGSVDVFILKIKGNAEYDYPCVDGGLRYYPSSKQIDDGFQKFPVIGRSSIEYAKETTQ